MLQGSTIRTRVWLSGPISLTMQPNGASFNLVPQTRRRDLLTTLAEANTSGTSECALDIVFQWGHNCLDIDDALRAYAINPLATAPARYMELFSEVKWDAGNPSDALRAIILAGSHDESNRTKLIELLEILKCDFRCAALYAAGSISDERLVHVVSKMAMSYNEANALATGELWALVFCFKRWIDTNTVTLDKLYKVCAAHQRDGLGAMQARRLINYVVCSNWRYLPYPEEKSDRQSAM